MSCVVDWMFRSLEAWKQRKNNKIKDKKQKTKKRKDKNQKKKPKKRLGRILLLVRENKKSVQEV